MFATYGTQLVPIGIPKSYLCIILSEMTKQLSIQKQIESNSIFALKEMLLSILFDKYDLVLSTLLKDFPDESKTSTMNFLMFDFNLSCGIDV